jgi:hypothetical protein
VRHVQGQRLGAADLQQLLVQEAGGAGKGIEGADLVVHGDGVAVPAHRRKALAQLGRVDGAEILLRHGLQAAGVQFRQSAAEQLGAGLAQALQELAAGLARADGRGLDGDHRTRVDPLVHAHEGDAGPQIAVHDGVLHGRDPAPARQQAEVHVETAQAGQREQAPAQDVPEGHHHHRVGRELGHGRGDPLALGTAAVLGQHGDAESGRGRLDRGGREPAAAPGATVRLRHHQGQLVAVAVQGLEAGHREFGRPHEHELHAASSPRRRRSRRRLVSSQRRHQGSRSMKRTPSRWSSSCWRTRARTPSSRRQRSRPSRSR